MDNMNGTILDHSNRMKIHSYNPIQFAVTKIGTKPQINSPRYRLYYMLITVGLALVLFAAHNKPNIYTKLMLYMFHILQQ